MADSVIDSKKVKKVETYEFQLEGHLLKWYEVMIQVSNISMLSASELPRPQFPIYSLVMLFVGSIVMSFTAESRYYRNDVDFVAVVCVLVMLAGVCLIIKWFYDVHNARGRRSLNIFLNSGYVYSIVFKNDSFLRTVLKTLSDIFKNGTNDNEYYVFNVEKCKIEHGSIVKAGTMNNG